MRVLTITNMYPSSSRPGWGSFIHSQVESIRKAGVEIDLLEIEGYRSRWNYFRAIWDMRRMIRQGDYDLIHAHYGLSGLVARCQLSLPVVVSFCGDDLYGHAGPDGRPRRKSLVLAWIHRQLSRFVDASIVKSAAMNSLLPRQDATVIPNGVDLDLFKPMDRASCRASLGLDPARLYILFPYGPDRARKNFPALREAVNQLNTEATAQGLIEILTIEGEPQERIPTYMNAADLMVLPSFWEGSPNAVKEALACNLKVVATDVGDVRERLADLPGTYVCDPTAASIAMGIRAVLADYRPVRSREAMLDLSLEQVGNRVIDVYRNIHRHRRNVLIIVENLPVPFDRRVWQQANALKANGLGVFVICPKRGTYNKSHEVINGIEVFRHPLPEARAAWGYPVEYGIALFWQLVLAFRIYFTRGFDVIHACNPPDLIFLVAAPFKLLGVRFIFDHHDLCPELGETKFGTGWKATAARKVLHFLERATFRLADASIATNNSYRNVAIQRGGMKPERVYVVRSAPDQAKWQLVEADQSLRSRARFLVGYVGVMGSQEGLSNLLAAISEIVYGRGRRDIRFMLIGDGPEKASLQNEAVSLGISEWVEFTGRVPDADLIRILSSCDICVNADLATSFNDLSSMNKIVEYMALGKAIVQVDLTEGRFTAMDAALCAAADDPIDFADKILDLLSDPERMQRMGAVGRKRLDETLAWKHQVPNLLACYSSVIGPFSTVETHAPSPEVLRHDLNPSAKA
ncbi:Glycosyltransferase involved in cell wall bisynthesis [Microvirga guangxiensis]|uniref:Glycosyltransferase involved in cell wall bisynthesis n=2 Tax=Microvirga guangxiensis TaxID=549386 RepID=A0A1G5H0S3_9HYPH|nr:Glycosyltransferase involved in cell wall bisynthesis [Microvirga guangxiensis]